MSINYEVKSVKDVKAVSGGVTQAKVLLSVSQLNSVAVTRQKDGTGVAYSLPRGNYITAEGETKWTKPLYPADAAAVKKAVEAIVGGDTSVGTWYPAKKEGGSFLGYAALKDVDVWVDVAVSSDGRLMMPTTVALDEASGEKKYSSVLPIKKDDPIRGEILSAISAAAA